MERVGDEQPGNSMERGALLPPWARGLAFIPTALAVAGVVTGSAVLERLDSAVAQMHEPDASSGGIGAVASPAALVSPQDASAIVEGWRSWTPTAGISADSAVWAYAAVDVVFALLIALLLARSLERLADGGTSATQGAVRGALTGASRVVTLYLLFDWSETLGLAATWRMAAPLLLFVIGLLSLLKWVALVLVISALGVGLLERWRRPPDPVPRPPGELQAQLVALRGQLVVLGALALVLAGLSGNIGRQMDDVVFRTFETPALAVGSLAAALLFAFVLFLGCRQTLVEYADVPAPGPLTEPAHRRMLVVGLLLVGVGGLALVARPVLGEWSAAGSPFVVVGAGVVLLWYLNRPRAVRRFRAKVRPLPPVGFGAVPYVVALAPFALFIAVLRALVRSWVDGQVHGLMLFFGAVLAGLVLAATWWVRRAVGDVGPPQGRGRWRPAERWSVAALVVLVVGAVLGPAVGIAVGSVTTLLLGVAGLTVLVTALVLIGDRWPARGVLALLGFRRVPVIALVIAVAVGVSLVDSEAAYYDARLLPAGSADVVEARPPLAASSAGGEGVDGEGPGEDSPGGEGQGGDGPSRPPSAFAQWIEAQQPPGTRDDAARPTVPLVLVSASGGGIRAAYWTSLAWECLYGSGLQPSDSGEEGDAAVLGEVCRGGLPQESVFLASSVSGSSAGLAMLRGRELGRDGAADEGSEPSGNAWLDAAFEPDYLAPAIAATIFRDLPNSVLRLPVHGVDRSSVLEQAWEGPDAHLGEGFWQSSFDAGGLLRFPVLLFNSTSIADGCRLAVVPIDGLEAAKEPDADCVTPSRFTRPAPGSPAADEPDGVLAATKDALPWTCDRVDGVGSPNDLRLSTAAMLSARFPYVSPAAGLAGCAEGDEMTYALDGGIVDNSGADALVEVWQALEPHVRANNADAAAELCIVPRLVMLDSGFASFGVRQPARRTLQMLAPGAGLAGAYETRSAGAQQEAMIEIARSMTAASRTCDVLPEPAVAHVFPLARPGSQAPLGWTLGERSQTVLQEELAGAENLAQLRTIREWYGG